MSKEKFHKLAKSRVNKAIKTIKLIGNLSNKSHYTYEQKEVDQIFNALNKEIKSTQSKFNHSKSSNPDGEFDFK